MGESAAQLLHGFAAEILKNRDSRLGFVPITSAGLLRDVLPDPRLIVSVFHLASLPESRSFPKLINRITALMYSMPAIAVAADGL